MAIDFHFTDHGTIALLTPLTEAAQAWVAEHLPVEPWQILGGRIAIAPRYAGPILDGLCDDGLTVAEG